MANKSNKEPETKIAVQQNQEMPSYLTQYQDAPTGLENLKKYFVPPRGKIVQAQSGEQFKAFGEGSFIIVPQMVKIAEPGQPFHITPIFQFTEYCVWNPYAMKNQLPVIRARSFDPSSEIAAKARSKETWSEECPEAPAAKKKDSLYMLRYCEHINFLCALVVPPEDSMYRVPFAISFHHSGFRTGQTFASLLMMRRAPIYSGAYEAKTDPMKNDLGNWHGLKLANPSSGSGIAPFIPEEEFLFFKNQFETFADLQARNEIMTEHDDESGAEVVVDSGGKF